MNRISLKIVGQSGSGLNSIGDIVSKALKDLGFYVVTDRDYPSLIMGGASCFHIDFSSEEIHSNAEKSDIMLALDEQGMVEFLDLAKENSVFVNGYEYHLKVRKLKEAIENNGIKEFYIDSEKILEELSAPQIMGNMVILGFFWKVLGLDFELIKKVALKRFSKKPDLLVLNEKAIKRGHDENIKSALEIKIPKEKKDLILINSNYAIALGAIHAGLRTFYAYPMSPASSILAYLAKTEEKTGMLVHQAEDEITAVTLTLGSMYAGSRSMVATSGGGFDLMTETLSAAGIMETPLLIVNAQRPGPGTGLPTWTSQGDVNLAVNAGHGEFARIVIAVSGPSSAFKLTQHALNLTEEFKVPVILLTEKYLAESKATVEPFKEKEIEIKRGIITDSEKLKELKSEDAYAKRKDFRPFRWLPGTSDAYYDLNADEHNDAGMSSESAEDTIKMFKRRLGKLEQIRKELPEPEIFGKKEGADISFVGFGSSRMVVEDIINEMKKDSVNVNYLHYEYLWPLKTEKLKEFFKNNKNVHLIEGNYTAQFGKMLENESGLKFKDKLLKYNGRPFYIEELKTYISSKLS